MNDSSIAVRYAKALFESARDAGQTQAVLDDMNSLEGLIQEVKSFSDFIDSPIIQISDKLRIIDELFKGNCQDLSFRFLALITRNKREGYLPAIIRKYKQLYRIDKGIISAALTTTSDVSDDLIRQVENILAVHYNTKVELNEKRDPELIGGFTLRVEDKLLDASVQSKLKRIKRELDETVMH